MESALVCWKCGTSLEELLLPVRRAEECSVCNADLHVCRMCEFYDPKVSKSCREPIADEVKEKQRANFCEYFKPTPGAYVAPNESEAAKAQRQFDSLFGVDQAPAPGKLRSAEDTAREQLDKLFGGSDKNDD